jgi:hypothetical protein
MTSQQPQVVFAYGGDLTGRAVSPVCGANALAANQGYKQSCL